MKLSRAPRVTPPAARQAPRSERPPIAIWPALVLLNGLASLALVPALRAMLAMQRHWLTIPRREAGPGGTPLVSVIVPARNEARCIERCISSILAQRYPAFEVIAIDDRSSDGTGEILARLARSDSLLRVISGEPLPPGWVGKCWAVYQAARQAKGEWLLFVDADTTHRPHMLASAVGFALEHGADLLTLGPRQELGSFWERAILPAIFGAIMTVGGSMADVNNPQRRVAKANGQFMLFRASSYWQLGGHEAVFDELVEDFAFARRVKGTGRRLIIADGSDLVSVRMYRSLREIWEGFGKNSYFEASREPGGIVAGILLPWLTCALPLLVGVILGLRRLLGRPTHRLERVTACQSALQIGTVFVFGTQVVRVLALPMRWALTVPAGFIFLSAVLVGAAYRIATGRGVVWRGRVYQPGE
ncbi:MAG: glycosyltransferase [Chloroflexi bacterium]|nr:glycosyltransferase [Chloroflexota bacterium]